MVKFINVGFIVLVLFSCRKDKVPDYLEAEYAFLVGEWNWSYSRVNLWIEDNYSTITNYYDFLYSEHVDKWCTIEITNQKKLIIKTNKWVSIKSFKPLSIVVIGSNKIARLFINELNQVITFVYSEALNTIESEFPIFQIPDPTVPTGYTCHPELETVTSIYEKL